MEKVVYTGPGEGFYRWPLLRLHMTANDVSNDFGDVEPLTPIPGNNAHLIDVRYRIKPQNVILSYSSQGGTEVVVSLSGSEEGIGEVEKIIQRNEATMRIIMKHEKNIRPEVVERLVKDFEEEERRYLDSGL